MNVSGLYHHKPDRKKNRLKLNEHIVSVKTIQTGRNCCIFLAFTIRASQFFCSKYTTYIYTAFLFLVYVTLKLKSNQTCLHVWSPLWFYQDHLCTVIFILPCFNCADCVVLTACSIPISHNTVLVL